MTWIQQALLNSTKQTLTRNVTWFNTLRVSTVATNVPFQNNANAVQTIRISGGDALHVCENVCVCTSTPVNESQAELKGIVVWLLHRVHQSHSTPPDFKTKHMHAIYAIKPVQSHPAAQPHSNRGQQSSSSHEPTFADQYFNPKGFFPCWLSKAVQKALRSSASAAHNTPFSLSPSVWNFL